MTQLALIAIDLAAIVALLALYFARHRRRDLVVAFLVVNVGVLAVTIALADAAVGAGLGLGLFGVLSIIRLRSSEIAQHEVAYYFASLAIGLVAGLAATELWINAALIGLVVAAIAIGDQRRLFADYRQQTVVLDRALTDERELHRALEELLHARVQRTTVLQLDLVDDTTTVDVRYRLAQPAIVREPIAGSVR